MAFAVDTDLLRENLKKAKKWENPQLTNRKDPPPELSRGLKYLIDTVLDPLSEGVAVHSSDLDFEQFSNQDLEDLYYYYMDRCYDGSKDWYRLKAVYTGCVKAASQTAPVQFL